MQPDQITMPKLFLILLSFLLGHLEVTAQVDYGPTPGALDWNLEEPFEYDPPTCEDGRMEAEEDISKGILSYLSFGLPSAYDMAYADFKRSYILEKYGVTTGLGGCVISNHSECYQKRMLQAIHEKYGKDFFSRVGKEARKAYPESDGFKREILPLILQGHFFEEYECDRGVGPEMGKRTLVRKIKEELEQYKSDLGMGFSIVVDLTKEGGGDQVRYSRKIGSVYENEIENRLRKVEWVPATYCDLPVNSRLEFYINLIL